MEAKVLLYDANDVKIGETFMRRARQLVKQQRAVWADDNHGSIRFAADVEDWDTIADSDKEEGQGIVTAIQDDDWLISLAEKRIKERMLFIAHSIAFVPAWIFLFFVFGAATSSLEIPMFVSGICVTLYFVHVWQYVKSRREYPSQSRDERRARRLAAEVAILKNELQTKCA